MGGAEVENFAISVVKGSVFCSGRARNGDDAYLVDVLQSLETRPLTGLWIADLDVICILTRIACNVNVIDVYHLSPVLEKALHSIGQIAVFTIILVQVAPE